MVLLTAMAAIVGGAGPVATAPDDGGAAFIAESRKVLIPWQKLPLLPARNISEVVRFTEVQGLLIADWPMLRDGPVSGRIPITDLPGEAIIECHNTVKYPQSLHPMFEYYDLTQPDFVCRHLQVFSSANRLMVVQDSESVRSFQTVSLLEIIGQTDDPPVTLRVQDLEDDKPRMNLVLTATSLNILRHEHPNEFEHFLRPMFRDFHQEKTVFWMDDRVDWQVLADEWHPSGDIAARVSAVMTQLKSGGFAQRQNAQKALDDIGENAALFLHASDRSGWTPEQIARVDQFLSGYFILDNEQVKKMGRDVNFLLDCMMSDDAELRAAGLARLDRVVGKKIEYKVDESPDERIVAIVRLRRELASKPQNSGDSK